MKMTLKERILRIVELKKRYKELKERLLSSETVMTLNLGQDWETEVQKRKNMALNQKSLEIQLSQINNEIEEEENYIKNLLLELNLEVMEFDLGDLTVRATRTKEPTITIIKKKVAVKNER
jgi:hypothetical protein